MSLTFLVTENSWHATMELKDFLEDIAAFRCAFTIMQIPQDTIDKKCCCIKNLQRGDYI